MHTYMGLIKYVRFTYLNTVLGMHRIGLVNMNKSTTVNEHRKAWFILKETWFIRLGIHTAVLKPGPRKLLSKTSCGGGGNNYRSLACCSFASREFFTHF